jgi:hypothetical protein
MNALDLLGILTLAIVCLAIMGISYALACLADHPPARVLLRSLLLWLAYSSVALVLDIIGLVIMVPLAAMRAWRLRPSKVYRSDYWGMRGVTVWRGGWLTWLWCNEEDGVTGPGWWWNRTCRGYARNNAPWWVSAWSSYRWSALRNPSNNMRFVPGINPVIRPEAVRSWEWRVPLARTAGWKWPVLAEAILTWQGPYSGVRLHITFRGHVFRFWWGWKLKPEDAQGIPPDDMRAPRCGFATQFKRIG